MPDGIMKLAVVVKKKRGDTNIAKLIPMMEYKRREYDYSAEDLAKILGMSDSTLTRRMNNPDDFKLSELKHLTKKLGISITIENGELSVGEKTLMH